MSRLNPARKLYASVLEMVRDLSDDDSFIEEIEQRISWRDEHEKGIS